MKNNEGRCVFCGAPLSNPLNNSMYVLFLSCYGKTWALAKEELE